MNLSIIDDHKLLAEILKSSLLECDFVNSINTYDDLEKLIAHIKVLQVDFLITDMIMPNITGLDVIKACRKIKSKEELKIIVLTSIFDTEHVREAIALGANGYISKEASFTELVDAIKQIEKDKNFFYLGSDLKDFFVQLQVSNQGTLSLSPLEKKLLQKLCIGKSGKEIAAEFDFKIDAVNNFKKQLMRKMDVNRLSDLILKAIKHGLFNTDYTT